MALRISTGLRNGLLDSGDFKTLMDTGVMRIYSGSQPADADTAESGTLLLEVSVDAGTFVADTGSGSTNGISFGAAAASGVLAKAAENWQGVGVTDGSAGWFRFYDATRTTGASSAAVRFDGSCGTSGSQLNMGSTTITSAATHTVDSFQVTLPAS